MLLGESAPGLIVGVNVAVWLVIHLGSVCISKTLHPGRFDPDGWLFKTRKWEREGRFYANWFSVKKWKDLLPDGARVSKNGFAKKRLASMSPAYLKRFIHETCRA